MTRKLAARLARIEVAMGVDPVKAQQQLRDADAERAALIALEESLFCSELLADCAVRCLGLGGNPRLHPGCKVLSIGTVAHLRALQQALNERGDAWAARVDQLAAAALSLSTFGTGSDFGRCARALLERCVTELRSLEPAGMALLPPPRGR